MENLNSNLIETSTIISELEDLFENTPRHCLKENASGWGTNERILFVKDKYLFYARMYEGYQDGLTMEIPQKHIKAFISIEDIYEVNYLPVDKMQKKTISILIPEKRINQQLSTLSLNQNSNVVQNNTPINETKNDKNNTDEKLKFIKWVFHFSYDLKEKLQQIRAIKREEERKKNLILIGEEEPEYQLEFANNIDNSSSPEKSPRKNMNESQYDEIGLKEYVDQIKKAKDYIKFKENREKMEKNERRKNKPTQEKFQDYTPFSNEEENFPIMNHWRQYFSAIQDIFSNKNPDRTIYEFELIIYKEVHEFKQKCIGIFKNYIFEKINAVNGEKWKFGDFYFYKGIWIKLGGKELNQEFLMYYNVADLTILLTKNKKNSYRVPDICLVDYLGFKALCMCDLPFSEIEKSEVYNMHSDTYDLQNMTKMKESLTMIEKALNLKNEDMHKANKKLPAPLGNGLRIFEYHPKKDIKNDQSTIEQFYYLTNLENIFPLDFNFQLEGPNLGCRFRPEIIGDIRQILELEYEDTQLLSTAFMVSGMNQEVKAREDDKIVKTSKFLIKERIPEFVEKLNHCELIIVDSYSLKMYMSEFGINMRYLYRVHELAKIKYLREVIEIECLARTIKSMYYEALKEFTNHIYDERRQERENEENEFDMEKSEVQHQLLQQKFKLDEAKIIENTIDFLNLIFGIESETIAFWEILCEKTYKKFKVKVEWPFEGSPGALLHAVLYNCGIEAVFNIEIPLFKTEAPFSTSNEINLQPKTKSFDFPSFEIQKLIRSVPSIETKDHPDMEILDSIALKLFKMDLLKNYYLYEGENNYHLSFSKINIVKDEMQKSRHVNSFHPSEISYFITNKSEVNFEKGLNLMTFCFSDYHPIYISYYEEYSKFFQPELLKKTAILQSIKCFGEFHPRTSEMYSGAYTHGFKEFYQKSLRTEGVLNSRINIEGMYKAGKYLSCMDYCLKQMKMTESDESRVKKENSLDYLQILFLGMKGALEIRRFEESLLISDGISKLLNIFKIRNYLYHFELIKETLRTKLILTPEKLFLYKLALLCINTREKFNEPLNKNSLGRVKPAEGKEKESLSIGIMNEYFTHDTHALWLNNIFKHLLSSYQYFNHLEDLFNNFEYHLTRYSNTFFVESLGYWDILVRLYGEDMFRDYLYETGNL